MKLRNRSVLAGAALVAVGAVVGAWVTAKTGQFPFSYSHVPAAAQSNADLDVSFKSGFGAVVKKVQPAVVSVLSTTNAKRVQSRRGQQELPDGFDLRDFFGGGGNLPDMQQGPKQGLGSGVIVSADGYIVTNNHVVDGADTVKVSLQDDREFTAKVIGKDADSDVAVLKIEASGLPHVNFGNSDTVEVGDIVLAMGNPFGIGQTVTMGIVGATHRNTREGIEAYEDFIQTDAAINPGNSGGALVNIKGDLVGINTAIISRGGGNQGVGFAIPAKTASNVMDQLVKNGKVSRGRMGVQIQSMNSDMAKQFGLSSARGALVGDVEEGSPAEKAGLKAGDVVTQVNGSHIADSADLRVRIAALAPGTTAKLKVLREGTERDINVVLGSQKAEEQASNGSGPAIPEGPRLGVSVEPATKLNRGRTAGLVIASVAQGSAAEEAGLRQGDVILEVNRKVVSDPAEFANVVRSAKEPLLLYVESNGAQKGAAGRHFVTVQPR
ncbi:MAG: DegQ family serine endoprotease [Bryobacteraceae bacterium]